jgi:hypothetical protein
MLKIAQMNRRNKIIAVLMLFVLNIVSCINNKPMPPQRKGNIPSNATWHGGQDGGCWIEITSASNDSLYTLNIYNDETGEYENGGVFKICSVCSEVNLTTSNLSMLIDSYDGEKVFLKQEVGKRSCVLEKVK